MESVGVHHAVVELAAGVGKLVVDAQKAHLPAVRHLFEIAVDLVDNGHDGHVVVAREDAGDDHNGFGRFASNRRHDSLYSFGDISNYGILRTSRNGAADVVRACQQNDDLRVRVIQLAVIQPPEDVLNSIRPPTEVGGIPAEEVLVPIGEQLRVIRRAPSPGDGVTFEIYIDTALLSFLNQLRVGDERVCVSSGNGNVGGNRRGGRGG